MILFENSFIKLTYDLTIDTLFVEMPTVDRAILPAVSHALDIIVEHVRNYTIENMVIDARDSEIFVKEEDYAAMIRKFSKALMKTHIKKIARIVDVHSLRENVVRKVYDDQGLSTEIQNFSEPVSALSWIKAKD